MNHPLTIVKRVENDCHRSRGDLRRKMCPSWKLHIMPTGLSTYTRGRNWNR